MKMTAGVERKTKKEEDGEVGSWARGWIAGWWWREKNRCSRIRGDGAGMEDGRMG